MNGVADLVVFLFLFLPRVKDFSDFFRPLNPSAAIVAVLGLEKNLALTVVAEESLLLGFFFVGDIGGLQRFYG